MFGAHIRRLPAGGLMGILIHVTTLLVMIHVVCMITAVSDCGRRRVLPRRAHLRQCPGFGMAAGLAGRDLRLVHSSLSALIWFAIEMYMPSLWRKRNVWPARLHCALPLAAACAAVVPDRLGSWQRTGWPTATIHFAISSPSPRSIRNVELFLRTRCRASLSPPIRFNCSPITAVGTGGISG